MLGIVILNYNEWNITINCVNSIRLTCELDYRIYIVDNASTEKMTHKFKYFIDNSEDCFLILSENNNGYAAGNNIGIQKALEDNCDYILITNNDVIFKNKSIDKLQDFLKKHCDYGIAGPKVYLQSGKIQEINMGCKMTMKGKYMYILRKTPLRKFVLPFLTKFHAMNCDLSQPFDVFAVSGCCFMISDKAINKLYPLDEHTFLYEEENIIGTRMEQLNLKTVYNTDSEIIHLGGASTKDMSEFSYKCFIKSEMYYCKRYLEAKWFQTTPLLILRIIIGIKNYGFRFLFNK